MNNNDILIRLRYALDFNNAEMVDIFELGGVEVIERRCDSLAYKTE